MPDGGSAAGHTAEPFARSELASDGSLVRRFRAGSEAAAGRLYRRYAARLRGLARAKASAGLARRVDADDIVQSVFRRFFTAARDAEYDVPAGSDVWNLLLVITLNKLRSEEAFHRAARRDLRRTPGSEDDSPLARVAARDEEAGVVLRLAVAEALERLPAGHRDAVELRMEGCEVAEIASRLGRSKRTVERLLQEARARLSKLVGEGDGP